MAATINHDPKKTAKNQKLKTIDINENTVQYSETQYLNESPNVKKTDRFRFESTDGFQNVGKSKTKLVDLTRNTEPNDHRSINR